jgi:hypothetical protein
MKHRLYLDDGRYPGGLLFLSCDSCAWSAAVEDDDWSTLEVINRGDVAAAHSFFKVPAVAGQGSRRWRRRASWSTWPAFLIGEGAGAGGDQPGQLGAMPEGNADAVVSSPPSASAVNKHGEGPAPVNAPHSGEHQASAQSSQIGYGDSVGQLGAMAEGNDTTPDTFWSAAAVIVAQCHAVIKPGGYAAWVTGNFVRKGQIVDFGRQWLRLCESVGFEAVEHIVAWKVEPGPTQQNMFVHHQDKTKERVSFFRRLANAKNPDAAIQAEDIYIVRNGAEVE